MKELSFQISGRISGQTLEMFVETGELGECPLTGNQSVFSFFSIWEGTSPSLVAIL
jgi:hypothetical protein